MTQVADAVQVGMVTWDETHNPEAAIRAALSAAGAGGASLRTNAEFEAALDAFGNNAYDVGACAVAPTGINMSKVWAARDESRQRVLAMHADARNAALWELRATLVARKERIVANNPERSPHSDLEYGTYLEEHEYIVGRIDAMLEGGDGE